KTIPAVSKIVDDFECVYPNRLYVIEAHERLGTGSPESNVMITRRLFIGASAAALLGGQSESAAQPKVPRIGVLVGAAPPHPFVDAFRRGLRTLGYLEGQNITLEIRYTGGRADRAAALAAELARLP